MPNDPDSGIIEEMYQLSVEQRMTLFELYASGDPLTVEPFDLLLIFEEWSVKQVMDFVEIIDVDADGKITVAEFFIGTSSPCELVNFFFEIQTSSGQLTKDKIIHAGVPPKLARDIFKSFNQNGDLAISYTEWTHVSHLEQTMYNYFVSVDTMDIWDFSKLFSTKSVVQISEIFNDLDNDRNQELSWPEFISFARIPNIPKCEIFEIDENGLITLVWTVQMVEFDIISNKNIFQIEILPSENSDI